MWKTKRKENNKIRECDKCDKSGQKVSLVLSAAEAKYGTLEDAIVRLFELEEKIQSVTEKYIDEHQKRIQLLDVVSRMEESENA